MGSGKTKQAYLYDLQMFNPIISSDMSGASYYRIIDGTEADISGIQNSMSYHEAEFEMSKEQYNCKLYDACNNKKCGEELTNDPEFLKCAGDCQQQQESISRFKEQIKESIDRKEKMTKMISNYEKQLELKKKALTVKLNTYLNN